MTSQDTDDSETGDDVDSGERTAEHDDTGDAVQDVLSEIASAPSGDIDAELEEIAAGVADNPSAAGSEQTADAEPTPSSQSVDPDEITVPEEFVDELDGATTETVARAILLLREELSAAQAELAETRAELAETSERADDLESRLARKQADFENYKKRQQKRLEEEKQRATEDLVERLLDVRDNLARALDQGGDVDIRDGVESTLEQFDQQLDRENVDRIEPAVGEETDPRRHEVLATIAGEQPAGTITEVHRVGYTMGEKVLRPAQVAVSDGSLTDEEA